MLFDINTYVGHWPFRQLRGNNCKDRLREMKNNGVDISVVSNLNGVFYKNTQSSNEELFEELKLDDNYKNHLIPFGVINPIYSGWREDFKVCIEEMGMKGIRIYPTYHRYNLIDPLCIELVKRARDAGVPIAISLRLVDSRVSSWLDISEEWGLKEVMPLIKEVPDAKYLILNVANSTELNPEDMALLKKTSFLMDTSGRALSNLGELIAAYGKEKFSFGTHSPILDNKTGLLRIETLTSAEANDQVKEDLRYGNAKNFFKV